MEDVLRTLDRQLSTMNKSARIFLDAFDSLSSLNTLQPEDDPGVRALKRINLGVLAEALTQLKNHLATGGD